MSHDVFISYSTKDKVAADRVCSGLESRGLQCWIAPRDIEAGTSYPSAIVHAVQSCRVFVLLLSSYSDASPHVKSEVQWAFDSDIEIIPFRIAEFDVSADLQYLLSTVQWMDAWQGSIDPHLEQLAQAVSDALKGARLKPQKH